MIGIALNLLKNRAVQGMIALMVVAFLLNKVHNQHKEIKRQSDNYEILTDRSNATLRLSREEFEFKLRNNEAIKRLLRDSLGIKTKQVERLTKASGTTKIRVRTRLIDSLVFKYDTLTSQIIDTIRFKTFTWSDDYTRIHQTIEGDEVKMDIKVTDSLIVVNHWYKEGKWFLAKWLSKRKTKTEITNMNPNASYTITERIEVVK